MLKILLVREGSKTPWKHVDYGWIIFTEKIYTFITDEKNLETEYLQII